MTIYTLVLYIAIAAVPLTLLTAYVFKTKESWLMSFLQNFCGALFIFSGWVKAVDPMGTAFKMEQYFAEFESTFGQTAMSFLAPLFPWLSSHSIVFSVAMIVFEIVLGLMLIIGARPKLTAWLFFGLVAFFTFLTGYTYLTGYVPSGVNFFEFGKWGEYVETNMKVTDCGCFGDFLKLKPKISFMKDVVLLVPALYFLFRSKQMHTWFNARWRSILLWVSTAALIYYCLSNYVWDEPTIDFRPFKIGTDVRSTKQAEADAMANVKITHYQMTNKKDGKVVTIPYEQYLKEFKNYPKEEWDFEQIKTEPTIVSSKISDFDVSGADGSSIGDAILAHPDYHFMVVAYKIKQLPGKQKGSTTVQDSIFTTDTVRMMVNGKDSTLLVKKFKEMQSRTMETEVATFDEEYVKRFTERINPLLEGAEKAGLKHYAVTAPIDPATLQDFRHATQSAYPFYTADDLLIKTIMRSNPGVLLWKDGKIVGKWHYRQLPSFEQIQAEYLK